MLIKWVFVAKIKGDRILFFIAKKQKLVLLNCDII